MNWKTLAILLSVAWVCYAADEPAHDEPGHEGHHHGGPPPKAWTITSLILTAGGGVLVSLTLLAILWKPIDAAFRRSRFRPRWEARATRIGFACAVAILAAIAMGSMGYWSVERAEHAQHEAVSDPLRPQHGGVVAKADRFVIELLARRMGEIRLFMMVTKGDVPTLWDVKPTVTVPMTLNQGSTRVATNQVLPMKATPDGGYFVARTFPFPTRQTKVHLSVKIKDQTFELDYDLPVQD